MSQMTSEINKITGTIIGISAKLIVYVLVVMLMVEGVSRGYAFGYAVFNAAAVAPAPGRDITVTIAEDASAREVASDLHKLGLIKSQYTFEIQKQFYGYELHPGTYVLNTSMTSKEMLSLINEEPKTTPEEEAASGYPGRESGPVAERRP